jgi:hypothetical protein
MVQGDRVVMPLRFVRFVRFVAAIFAGEKLEFSGAGKNI